MVEAKEREKETKDQPSNRRKAIHRFLALAGAGGLAGLLWGRMPESAYAANTFPADGYVGIGTTSPVRLLHIQGHDGAARFDRDVDSAAFFFVRTAQNDFNTVWKCFTFGVKATGVDTGSFFIGDMHTAVSGSSNNRLLIDTLGNVGIGTTTPSEKLEVAGNVKIGSNYVDLSQLGTPADPAAGTRRLFVDSTDGKLKVQTDTGTSVSLEEQGGAHALLSATHTDTVVGSPRLGDMLYADSTPVWTTLSGTKLTTRHFLTQTGTGAFSAAPQWEPIAAGDLPLHEAAQHTGNILPGANQNLGGYYMDITQIAAPSDPAAGSRRLFVDSGDGKLKVRTSAGTSVSVEEQTGWSLTGNAGTSPGTDFLGTTDNNALELKVNNTRAFRLEPKANGPNVIGGCSGNSVTSGLWGATIAGGGASGAINQAEDNYCTVGGGYNNVAGSGTGLGECATVAGGRNNTASTWDSTISGGSNNSVALGADSATVSGGYMNAAKGSHSMVPGGAQNTAWGNYSFAAGMRAKTHDSLGFAHAGAFVWADANNLDFYSAADNEFAVRCTGGARFVTAIDGSGTPTALVTFAPSGSVGIGITSPQALLHVAGATPNIIMGDSANTVASDIVGATVSGGGKNDQPNTASGDYSTVPGGAGNVAKGDYSFAAGRRAKAQTSGGTAHQGAFVWADSIDLDLYSERNCQFRVRANGGARFDVDTPNNRWVDMRYVAGPPSKLIDTSTGAYLSSGGAWTDSCDRNLKENFVSVDGEAILQQLSGIPITKWNYKAEDASVRHIGPTAQDFYAAFHLGGDDRHIATVDAGGVALLSIQALHKISLELRQENKTLKQEVGGLRARLEALEQLAKPIPAS